MNRMSSKTTFHAGSWALLASALVACGSNPPDVVTAYFESDDPSLVASSSQTAHADFDGASVRPRLYEGAERGASQIDIAKIEGDRLYSLSPSGDLSVIDLGSKGELRLLGRSRALPAKPFHLHLRDQVVLGAYSDEESTIVAVDTSDPEDIREVGRFELAATITDSWLVDDVLYLVSHQRGEERLVVTSLDVEDPSAIRKIDEVSFSSKHEGVATIATKRIYVASQDDDEGSTIQIIDIEESTGGLALGASVTVEGSVSRPSQLDEHEGVLRVLGQSESLASPMVQTFEIAPTGELQPLGSLELALPPNGVTSILFDGTRAFATTFDGEGPLITIDLSDPQTPQQLGELSMPGWAQHIELRGERLYAFGFDNEDTNQVLNVSIIDVSDPSKPTMLDRAELGGTWSTFAESQYDGRKATPFLSDEGLLLVPFSGYVYGEPCDRHMSGVQLVEVVGDELTKRGVALSRGGARRAFLRDGMLIGVSNEQVQVFDIDDRDQPKSLASATIGHRVDRTLPHGDHLIRLAIDPWTKTSSLEIVAAKDANQLEPLGSIEIGQALAGSNDPACGFGELHRDRFLRLFAEDDRVYVVAPRPYWQKGQQGTTVLVVDIEDPEAPRISTTLHYDFSVWHWDQTGQNWSTALIEGGSNVVQTGHRLAAIERRDDPYAYGAHRLGDTLHVLDLRDPEAPKHETVALPDAAGRTKLHAHEGAILLGHWVPVTEKPGRVRFHVDRVDISDGPVLRTPVNVPGSLLYFDDESQRLVTVDYRRETSSGHTWKSCYPSLFDSKTGTCTVVHRTLHLLELTGDTVTIVDSKELADDLRVVKVVKGDDRVTLAHGQRDDAIQVDCEPGYYCPAYDGDSIQGESLLVVGGARTGKLELVSPTSSVTGFSRLAASGQWVVKSRNWGSVAEVVDLRTLEHVAETKVDGLHAGVRSLSIDHDRAFFALGEHGLTVFGFGD